MNIRRLAGWATWVLLAAAGPAAGQFDPSKAYVQPEAIARQFPDPPSGFPTPAFAPGRQDFTSHAEATAFLDALARRSDRIAIETAGRSQRGLAVIVALLTGPRGFDPRLPTVLLLAQQHGNEPAGGEAALALAQNLATDRRSLLDRVNVAIVPRANPDAAERFARESANGIDINRDHLLLRTPEAQAIAAVVRRLQPQVILDLHEFTVAGRWVSKFGGLMRDDALLQAATVANLGPAVQAAQSRYQQAARNALEAAGHRVADYHTASTDPKDRVVSMGGVNADTGRNVGGLRHAVSLLLETRGVGLGRAHFARRVHSHVVASLGVIEAAAQDGATLLRVQQEAGAAAAGQACRGDLTVEVRQTPERRTLSFLDSTNGEPRDVEVDWRSSHSLQTVRERPRPCGYLLGSGQSLAVARLQALGVTVDRVLPTRPQADWAGEDYLVEADTTGQRQDARGAIADSAAGVRLLKVRTQAQPLAPAADDFYVSMNQPLAALIAAALEPDTQNSFAANRLLSVEGRQLRRVMQTPPPGSLRPLTP